MKNRKIWIGVGAFVLAGTGAGSPEGIAKDSFSSSSEKTFAERPSLIQLVQATGTDARGEGGEGGEAGIDIDAASRDPLAYGIALQVIAAHYHAGLAAYETGEREAGAQMFAHGLSEVYVEMEDNFKKLGVTDLGPKLEAAVAAASEKKPVPEVQRRANAVFAALTAAEKKAPKSEQSAMAVKAQLIAELIDRSAAQYDVTTKDNSLEAYLDGLGFVVAARKHAAAVLPQLKKQDRAKEATIQRALAMAAQAFPGAKRTNNSKVTVGDFLAAASAAKLAVSGLK